MSIGSQLTSEDFMVCMPAMALYSIINLLVEVKHFEGFGAGDGAISVGAKTRIVAGSVVLHDLAADSTVVGVPGRVVLQSGVRIDPLSHSALPDTEAQVIRNLLQRIDALKMQLLQLNNGLQAVAAGEPLPTHTGGTAQSLDDREILEFLLDSGSTELGLNP